jgi:hypothetical protein
VRLAAAAGRTSSRPSGSQRLVGPVFTAYGSPTGLDNIDPFLSRMRQGGVAVSLRMSQLMSGNVPLESALSRFGREENRLGDTERARRADAGADRGHGGVLSPSGRRAAGPPAPNATDS